MQWLNGPDTINSIQPQHEDSSLDDSFELIEKNKHQQLRKEFESVVFKPFETDEYDIHAFLTPLFKDDKAQKALDVFRKDVGNFGTDLMKDEAPFELVSLRQCIRGLLGFGLLKNENKNILQDFLSNDGMLTEIADILNMRWRSIGNWSWDAPEGIPAEPRMQQNGRYGVIMEESILESTFAHYMGTKWSVKIKEAFEQLAGHSFLFDPLTKQSGLRLDWARFYLRYTPDMATSANLQYLKQQQYKESFFMSQLPDSEEPEPNDFDEYDDHGTADNHPHSSWKSLEHRILRDLAAETRIMYDLHGRAAVVQSDLHWYYDSLSHQTVKTVLEFCGVSKGWIEFFCKFLETPLNMWPSSGDESARARYRKRGIPIAHSIGNFVGEVVLFFLDWAVYKRANTRVYRLRDNMWVWGDPDKCARAWGVIDEFLQVMGLEVSKSKTGSAYLSSEEFGRDEEILDALPNGPVFFGLLYLDEEKGSWEINQDLVNKHVEQLKKRLGQCKSIMSWTRTWNNCIGRFFGYNLGSPSVCFGRSHIDGMLDTHKRIQQMLFPDPAGANVLTHLKSMISKSFGVNDVPDAFIFLPEEFGGLGMRNPLRTISAMRDEVTKNPEQRIEQFLADEYDKWSKARDAFERTDKSELMRRFESEMGPRNKQDNHPPNMETAKRVFSFMGWDEFKSLWETNSLSYKTLFQDLTDSPWPKSVSLSSRLWEAVDDVDRDLGGDYEASDETIALVCLYADELFEKFGGLSIVKKDMLPLGVLRLLRERKVSWPIAL